MLSKNKFHMTLDHLEEDGFGFISHEAIKVTTRGRVFVDPAALIYPEGTPFNVFKGKDGSITIVDYSNHVWTPVSHIPEEYIEVTEYVEQ